VNGGVGASTEEHFCTVSLQDVVDTVDAALMEGVGVEEGARIPLIDRPIQGPSEGLALLIIDHTREAGHLVASPKDSILGAPIQSPELDVFGSHCCELLSGFAPAGHKDLLLATLLRVAWHQRPFHGACLGINPQLIHVGVVVVMHVGNCQVLSSPTEAQSTHRSGPFRQFEGSNELGSG